MMRFTARHVCGAAALLATLHGTARAQTLPADPAAEVGRVQIGPVALNPRFEILNAGIDSNVFNDEEGPKQDFTATVRPSLDAALRLGRARFTYRSWMDVVYFHEYKDERSLNRSAEARAEVRLARIVPYVMLSGLSTRERPNNEIDLRARRSNQTLGAGAALLVLSRTSVVVAARRETSRFSPGQLFGGEDLAVQLDSTRDSVEGGVKLTLTPLTSVTLMGTRERTTFDFSSERDSESTRVVTQFDFDPTAVISGTAAVGYRRFTPQDPALSEYRGIVARVAVRYTLFGRTRVAVQFDRDVEYSFEQEQPYYVSTGGTVTVTQQVGGPFDVQVTAGRQRLDYQARADAPVDLESVDTATVTGGGVGYRLGATARLGVNVEFSDRAAHRPGRSYDRRRIFGSITYRF
jgi:putative beta-barrel porin BBP2